MNEKQVTIIICTHNRAELLSECLNSLNNQTVSVDLFDILVVDNASKDDTKKVVDGLKTSLNNLHYTCENEIGLSAARNRGFMECKTEWLTYLDDDAKAHDDFVEQILKTISNTNWDIIGGIYHQWFRSPRPDWFPNDEGTNKYEFPEKALLPEKKFASGGNMTIRKDIFTSIGGFKTNLGMKGEAIYYGEEVEFQIRARENGFRIGVNPHIEIDHLVRDEKLQIHWWLESYFQKGKSSIEIFKKREDLGATLIIKAMVFSVVMLPYFLAKLLFVSRFKWGNFLIKYLGPLYYLRGKYVVLRQKG